MGFKESTCTALPSQRGAGARHRLVHRARVLGAVGLQRVEAVVLHGPGGRAYTRSHFSSI